MLFYCKGQAIKKVFEFSNSHVPFISIQLQIVVSIYATMDSTQQPQKMADDTAKSQSALENGHVMKTFTWLMNGIRNTAENHIKILTQETSFNSSLDGSDPETQNHDVTMTNQECKKDETTGDHIPVEEQFMTAIESGNVNDFMDIINQKEKLNLDIEYVNDNGQTPMRLAIASGHAGKI